MKLLVRILVAGLFIYTYYRGFFDSGPLDGVDVFLLMATLLLGAIAVSISWAPAIGSAISEPVTSALTGGFSIAPADNRMVRLIYRLEHQKARRRALALSFLEGMRHPDQPYPALLALRNTLPGSLLEKLLAREVYQYNNVANCMKARKILIERHQEIPPMHPVPEVAQAIQMSTREVAPPATILAMVRRPQLDKPARNPNIRLFDQPNRESGS